MKQPAWLTLQITRLIPGLIGQRFDSPVVQQDAATWPFSIVATEQGLAAVSVQAESCLIAGIAATVALVHGAQAGQRWLDQLGLAYVTVDRSGRRRFGPASASDQGAGAAGPINGSESVPSTLT